MLFCERKNTEPAYFKALKRQFLGVLVVLQRATGGPSKLVEEAIAFMNRPHPSGPGGRRRDSFEDGDRVWVVFDIDKHEKIEESVLICKEKGIGVARSNPCFELWLVLHIMDFDKLNETRGVSLHLQSLRAEYDPSRRKIVDCQDLIRGLNDAERRAEKQLKRREDEGAILGRPSTTVFRLTREIRAVSDRWNSSSRHGVPP